MGLGQGFPRICEKMMETFKELLEARASTQQASCRGATNPLVVLWLERGFRSAQGKRGQRKGATSKIVMTILTFPTISGRAKPVKKSSKVPKVTFDPFQQFLRRPFSTIFARHQFSSPSCGGSDEMVCKILRGVAVIRASESHRRWLSISLIFSAPGAPLAVLLCRCTTANLPVRDCSRASPHLKKTSGMTAQQLEVQSGLRNFRLQHPPCPLVSSQAPPASGSSWRIQWQRQIRIQISRE